MDKIQIIHNFLDSNDLSILLNSIEKNYTYGIKSDDQGNHRENFFFLEWYDKENSIATFLLKKICFAFSKNFKIYRSYVQVQTYFKNGNYHIDDPKSDRYTCCIYLTDVSDDDLEIVGGNFYIKIPNEKYIMSIETSNNKAILFPSNYFHNGMAYNRYTNHIKRTCVVLQLEII